MARVVEPFPVFFDDDGTPLDAGMVYVGEVNQDARANPVNAFWDDALTIPVMQPVRTLNGRPAYQGTPANIYIAEPSYSIEVQNRLGTPVLSSLDVSPLDAIFAVTVATRAELKALDVIRSKLAFLNEGDRKGWFRLKAGTPPVSDTLEGIYIISDTASFYWQRVWDEITGQPEWFGAIINNSAAATTNLAAIHACYAICPCTEFGAFDYWVSGTVLLNRSYRTVRGVVLSDGQNTGTGTRIISNNAAVDVCRVGPDSVPVSTATFLRNIKVEGLCFMMGVTRIVPTPGNEKTGPANFRIEYVISCEFTDIFANEPLIGFAYRGVVFSRADRMRAFRTELFGGNDYFYGHLTTGAGLSAYGFPGQNASMYGDGWSAAVTGSAVGLGATRRLAIWLDGAWTDTFLSYPETLACGIKVTGDGIAATTGANSNCEISFSRVDQYDGISYDISDINLRGAFRLIEPCAGCPAGVVNAVSVLNCSGAIVIRGGDLFATAANPSGNMTIGVGVNGCTGTVDIEETILHEFGKPVTIEASVDVSADVRIVNHGNVPASPQGAVALANSQRIFVTVSIKGRASAYPQAIITFDALCTGIFDASRVAAATIAGGAANRIVANLATTITTPGYFTSAGAAGTPGAGINVIGLIG